MPCGPGTQRHTDMRHRPPQPRRPAHTLIQRHKCGPGQRAHGVPQAWPRSTRVPEPNPPQTPNVTGFYRTHTPTGRPQHLPPSWRLRGSGAGGRGGGRDRGLRVGSGAGSGWGPLQRPRLGPRVRRPSALSTGSAAPAASAVSYARARGGDRRRPIRGAASLTDGPRPRPWYCSCPPHPQPPLRGNAAGGGIPEIPARKNLETLTVWGHLRVGDTEGGRAPEFPSLWGCAMRDRDALREVDTRWGKAL